MAQSGSERGGGGNWLGVNWNKDMLYINLVWLPANFWAVKIPPPPPFPKQNLQQRHLDVQNVTMGHCHKNLNSAPIINIQDSE